MIGSDGLPHDRHPHPRLWGAFPRVLARYWRERRVLPLEQAIYKMTGLSARNFRLPHRGQMQEGWYADVVVFDPQTVRDRATYAQPQALSEGIVEVYVNGRCSWRRGEPVLQRGAGRLLKRGT
jgi:N-acyl-D-amino-acid deacylase